MGFPNFDRLDTHLRRKLQTPADVEGDILGAGVQPGLEGLDVVQVRVVERVDDAVEQPLELVEIHDHADLVEPVGGGGYDDDPVMPMQRLERAVVQPKLMCGGELTASGDGERGHRRESYTWHGRLAHAT